MPARFLNAAAAQVTEWLKGLQHGGVPAALATPTEPRDARGMYLDGRARRIRWGDSYATIVRC